MDFFLADCLRFWSLAISPFSSQDEAAFCFRVRGSVFLRIVLLGSAPDPVDVYEARG
jgi:hypothetical protein